MIDVCGWLCVCVCVFVGVCSTMECKFNVFDYIFHPSTGPLLIWVLIDDNRFTNKQPYKHWAMCQVNKQMLCSHNLYILDVRLLIYRMCLSASFQHFAYHIIYSVQSLSHGNLILFKTEHSLYRIDICEVGSGGETIGIYLSDVLLINFNFNLCERCTEGTRLNSLTAYSLYSKCAILFVIALRWNFLRVHAWISRT